MKKIVTLLLTVIVLACGSRSNGQTAINLLSEGFESGTFPPAGWTIRKVVSGNNKESTCQANTEWQLVAHNSKPCGVGGTIAPAHSGSWMAGYNTSKLPNNNNTELTSPVLNFTPPASGYYQVSFWMYRVAATGSEEVMVYVNTASQADGGALLGTIRRNLNSTPIEPVRVNGWYQYSFRIPDSFNTATNYITIKATSHNSSATDTYIDDISVDNLLPCIAPTAHPTSLILTPTYSVVAGSFTAASSTAEGYLVVRTPGLGTLNTNPANGTMYSEGDVIGNGTVVSVGLSTTFVDTALLPAGNYTYTVFPYSHIMCADAPAYFTTNPLRNSVWTTSSPATYTWNATTSADFQDPASWTPARLVTDPNDLLVFNNGLADTAENVPTQRVGRLMVDGNTNVHFRSTAVSTFTIMSDNNPATDELFIGNGSSLILDGNTSLTLAFGGNGGTNRIAGTLEIMTNTGTATANFSKINFTNSITTVSGTLAAGGAEVFQTVLFTSTVQNLIITGNYIHKYTTAIGNTIPTATWAPSSNMQITAFTTALGQISGLAQTFNDVTYNCPLQTSTTQFILVAGFRVNGTLAVNATGTGAIAFATTHTYTGTVNNYTQTGGTVDLSSGNTTNSQVFNVAGTFNQTSGIIKSSNTSGPSIISFIGTGGPQNVNFADAAPAGRVIMQVANGDGINLTGSGTLTSAFTLNNGGGIRISTLAPNPINTTLALSYATGATLTYDMAGDRVMTAAVFPAANLPGLIINIGKGNVITMPFDRTIAGTLTITSGDLDIANNQLTIGSSAAIVGTISAPGGSIRVSPGGALTRWYTSLPTTAGTGVGFYPLAYGAANRNVSIYGTGAVSTPGTITVRHSPGIGLATGLSVMDGGYTIQARTNSSWNISYDNGFAVAAGVTMGIKATGGYLIDATSGTNLRLMRLSTLVGTHFAGSGTTPNFNAERRGIALTDLAGDFYIGAASADMKNVLTAVVNGNWSNPGTWYNSIVPTIADVAVINPGVTVTADAGTNAVRSLAVGGSLVLNNAAHTLTVDSALINAGNITVNNGTLKINGGTGANGVTNNGTVTVNGGTFTVGATPGYNNKPFTNNGILNVNGGELNINGNLNCVAGSAFSQSNGNITVDGNAGGVIANSAANGSIVSFKSPNLVLTGGTFTITDPHPAGFTAFEYSVTPAQSVNASPNHTFRMGDGVSLDPGPNNGGFGINTAVVLAAKFAFGNLVINSGAAANSYVIGQTAGTGQTSPIGVLGDFTVNNGGEYRYGYINNHLYLNGNLTVNPGGTLTLMGILYFANYASGVASGATQWQNVYNYGTIRNGVTPPAIPANFYGINVINANGVTFNSDLSYSNTLQFFSDNGRPSKIYMAGGSTLKDNSASGTNSGSEGDGWVIGKYTKTVNLVSGTTFGIGDSTTYAPITFSAASFTSTNGTLTASTTGAYHPNMASITLDPLQTIKRYYTLSANNVVASDIKISFVCGAADVGNMNPYTFAVARYRNAAWTYPTTGATTVSQGLYYVPATGQTVSDIDGEYTLGIPCVAPVIATQPATQTVCINGSVQLNVFAMGTGLSYQWRKGTTPIAGAQSSSYTIPSTQYADEGDYNVVVSNGCGTSVTSDNATVSIGSVPTINTHPATQAVCTGKPVTFTVGAPGTAFTYQWYKGASPINLATGSSYTISNAAPGDAAVYSVRVTSPCGGIATSNNATLTVNTSPAVPVVTPAGPTTFCSGDNVVLNTGTGIGLTYQWKKDGLDINTATNPAYTATATGNYTVVVTSGACSESSAGVTVTVNQLPAFTVSPNTAAVCIGDSTILTATGTTSYTWAPSTGLSATTGSSVTAKPTSTITYTITGTDANNCTSTITKVVTVHQLPAVSISPADTALCMGDIAALSASGDITSYSWSPSGSLNTATGNDVIATPSATTTYTVTGSDTNGCTNAATVIVTVHPLPQAVINIAPDGKTLSTTHFASYQWNHNGQSIDGATGSSYEATKNGDYTVTVTDSNGCTNISDTVNLTDANRIALSGAMGEIKFYPNPAVSMLHIDAPVAVNIALYSIDGKMVLQIDQVKDIDISSLAAGSYVVSLSDASGKLLKTGKLIKMDSN